MIKKEKFKIAAKVFVCVFRPGGRSVRRAGSLLHTSSVWAQTAANLHLHLWLVRNRTVSRVDVFFFVNLLIALSVFPQSSRPSHRHIRLHRSKWGRAEFLEESSYQLAGQKQSWLVERRTQWGHGLDSYQLCEMTTSDSDPSQQCK